MRPLPGWQVSSSCQFSSLSRSQSLVLVTHASLPLSSCNLHTASMHQNGYHVRYAIDNIQCRLEHSTMRLHPGNAAAR